MMEQPPVRSESPVPLLPALVLFGGIALILLALLAARPEKPGEAVVIAPTEGAAVLEATAVPPTAAPAQAALDPQMVSAGGNIYQSVCVACHGFNAMGIPGLGKPLIGSQFVNGLNDDELVAFLQVGRQVTDPLNSTGVMMPPKGGNPALTDKDLYNVVAYIRSLNQAPAQGPAATSPTATPMPATQPTSTPAQPAVVAANPTAVAAAPTTVPVPYVPAGPLGGDSSLTGGDRIYVRSCAGCHGPDGSGVTMIAGPLSASQMVQKRDGIALLLFLSKVQPPVDPRQSFPHPARGGYPVLTDEQLLSVIGYMYSLPGAQPPAN